MPDAAQVAAMRALLDLHLDAALDKTPAGGQGRAWREKRKRTLRQVELLRCCVLPMGL